METRIFKTFEEWLAYYYWDGFDTSGLSDEEYYELEDAYWEYCEQNKDLIESLEIDN